MISVEVFSDNKFWSKKLNKPNIFLDGEKELITQRVTSRKGHFFSETLLQTQFDILEKPAYGMKVSIAHSLEEICHEILDELENTDAKRK